MYTNGTFDKDQFLKEVNGFPSWIKTPDDLMNYCRHLKYRLFQKTHCFSHLTFSLEIPGDIACQNYDLANQYDKAFLDSGELQTFHEAFENQKCVRLDMEGILES
jgi:hypothetical protein